VVFRDDRDKAATGAEILRKHEHYIREHFAPGDAVQVFARHTGAPPPRLLFIEDTVPLRRIGSGFVRSNDLVKVTASLGYQITVYPVNGCAHDPAHVFGDMPDTAEVMHDRSVDGFEAFLADRIGYYNVIWIARTHNLDRVRQHLSKVVADEITRPLIILDSEAVAPLREAEQARLVGRQYDVDAAVRAAFVNADICDAVIAVTPQEAATLQAIGLPRVTVIGHTIEPRPTQRPFTQRAGMLFVGAIHTTDSPNLDSLVWFVDEVLPLVEDAMGWETRLTIAGYTTPGIDLARFEDHPRITLRGTVANLEPLYDIHRVFVAPTRYAAGTPYKVFEAASRGLPVVATDLLRRQLEWTDHEEMLSAGADDPKAFAAAVIALYQQERLWRSIRESALQRLRRENGLSDYVGSVARLLASASRAN
jgi:glycosyltransferase involved in cell wall biosynthesis